MDAVRLAERVIARLRPPTETAYSLWLDMLDVHWDYYAEIIASLPDSTARKDWNFAPDDTGFDAQYFRRLGAEDDALARLWQALTAFREVWQDAPDSPDYIHALEGVSRVLWQSELRPCPEGWIERLCCPPHPQRVDVHWGKRYADYMGFARYDSGRLYPWEDYGEFEPTDYNVLFLQWLPRDMQASDTDRRLHAILRGRETGGRNTFIWDYHHRQEELRARRDLAFHSALTDLRRQLIEGVPPNDMDYTLFEQFEATPDGNYDEQGRIIWYQDLTPEKQREWDTWKAENGVTP